MGALLVLSLWPTGCASAITSNETAEGKALIESFFSATSRGEPEKAYDLFSAEIKQKFTLQEFKSDVSRMDLYASFLRFDLKDATKESIASVGTGGAKNSAVLHMEGTIVYSSGRQLPLVAELMKQQGEWRFVVFQLN